MLVANVLDSLLPSLILLWRRHHHHHHHHLIFLPFPQVFLLHNCFVLSYSPFFVFNYFFSFFASSSFLSFSFLMGSTVEGSEF
jgi:hypothetical protein